jgi:hypothetical protein
MPRIHLLLVLLIASEFGVAAEISIPMTMNAGDRHLYGVVQFEDSDEDGTLEQWVLAFDVIESSPEGSVLSLQLGSLSAGGEFIVEQPAEGIPTTAIPIELEFDSSQTLLGIRNWRQMGKQMQDGMTREMERVADREPAEKWAVMKPFLERSRARFGAKDFLQRTVLNQFGLIFAVAGQTFDSERGVSDDTRAITPYQDLVLPVESNFEVTWLGDRSLHIHMTQSLSGDELLRAMAADVGSVDAGKGEEFDEFVAGKSMEFRREALFELSRADGWVDRVEMTTNVQIDEQVRSQRQIWVRLQPTVE